MSGSAALNEAMESFPQHLRTLCNFALNLPPMRAKVDRQSFDELQPGFLAAVALLDWHEALVRAFVAAVGSEPSNDTARAIVSAVDCCVVLENQARALPALEQPMPRRAHAPTLGPVTAAAPLAVYGLVELHEPILVVQADVLGRQGRGRLGDRRR